jgi:hypothetical protein
MAVIALLANIVILVAAVALLYRSCRRQLGLNKSRHKSRQQNYVPNNNAPNNAAIVSAPLPPLPPPVIAISIPNDTTSGGTTPAAIASPTNAGVLSPQNVVAPLGTPISNLGPNGTFFRDTPGRPRRESVPGGTISEHKEIKTNAALMASPLKKKDEFIPVTNTRGKRESIWVLLARAFNLSNVAIGLTVLTLVLGIAGDLTGLTTKFASVNDKLTSHS